MWFLCETHSIMQIHDFPVSFSDMVIQIVFPIKKTVNNWKHTDSYIVGVQHYVIMFVGHLRQVSDFIRIPPPQYN